MKRDLRVTPELRASDRARIRAVLVLVVLLVVISPAMTLNEYPLPVASVQSCAGWSYWPVGGSTHTEFECVSGGFYEMEITVPGSAVGWAEGRADTDYGVNQGEAIIDASDGVTAIYATGESRSFDTLDPPGGSTELLENFLCATISGHTENVDELGAVQVSIELRVNDQNVVNEFFFIEENQRVYEHYCGTFQYRETEPLEIEQELIVEAFSPTGVAYAGHAYEGHAEGNFMGTMVLSVLDVDPYYLEHSASGTSYPIIQLPFIDGFELGDFVAWPATVQ